MYVLDNNECKYVSLANDTNNISIHKYKFPDEETIRKNVTTTFIVIPQHKSLITSC